MKNRKCFLENNIIYSYNKNDKNITSGIILEENGNCFQYIKQNGEIYKKLIKCAESYQKTYLKDIIRFRNLYTNIPILYEELCERPIIRNIGINKIRWNCNKNNWLYNDKIPCLRSVEALGTIKYCKNMKNIEINTPMMIKYNGKFLYYPIKQIISLLDIPPYYNTLVSLYLSCILLFI